MSNIDLTKMELIFSLIIFSVQPCNLDTISILYFAYNFIIEKISSIYGEYETSILCCILIPGEGKL